MEKEAEEEEKEAVTAAVAAGTTCKEIPVTLVPTRLCTTARRARRQTPGI